MNLVLQFIIYLFSKKSNLNKLPVCTLVIHFNAWSNDGTLEKY